MDKSTNPQFPTKRIWILYCRCSRQTQSDKHFSIETQECEWQKYAEAKGIQILKIIKDTWQSWSNFDRDGLSEALEIIKKNRKAQPITDIILMDQSRLSRNDDIIESLMMARKIREYGVHINYIMYPIDTESSVGILQEQMLYSFAAFERRNITAKALNWMRMRLFDGYRPFAILPAGYKREWTGKEKRIVIDEFKWPILKEALEMYASGVILSDSWFFKYLKDKGFTSNTNKDIHPSIVHTMFSDHRLYFNAGFLLYSPWGLDKPILWKQPALISLETMQKIKTRRANSLLIWKTKDWQDSEFPLKELVRCPECHRKITWYFSKWKREYYPYYWCQKAWCTNRFCVNRKVFVSQFNEFLDSIKIDSEMCGLFRAWLQSIWENRQAFDVVKKLELQNRIEEVDKKLKEIPKKVLSISNTDLLMSLENQREEYKIEKDELQKQLDGDMKLSQDAFMELVMNAEKIFSQPKEIFNLWNKELQKMTMSLLFGDDIFYSKEKKFRTPEKSLLNLMFTTVLEHETFGNPIVFKGNIFEHLFNSFNPIVNVNLGVLSDELFNDNSFK